MKIRIGFLTCIIFFAWVASFHTAFANDDNHPVFQDNRHYSFIYWENGYPTREAQSRRPQSWANTNARENPDLVIQTGYYSLVLDMKRMQIEGYDALEGSDYISALHEDVTEFTPASLILKAYQDGVEYTATAGVLQDGNDVHVRLIESGQFLQRYDHLGIIFTAQDGTILDVPARLEISAWPEQVTFKLDFANVEGTPVNIDRTVIELTSPTGKNYLSDSDEIAALLSIRPHEDLESVSLDPAVVITEATDLQKNNALEVEFDNDLHAIKVNLPINGVRYPDHINRVDEFIIELANPTQSPLDIPLVFEENVPRAITGTVMLLTDAEDGKPTGIPVQISKNWHVNDDTGLKAIHHGYWLRGSTYLTLPAGVTKRFKLKVVFGYWAQAAAASHAQLSLIGWGGNWKWDESALGSWGESMTYDPTQHLGSAFMDDIRPAFTPSMSNGGSHNWTENVGGGDFLIYFDENNRYRWGKRLKTAYVWTGPNMTEILYSGITDDNKIRFEYVSKLSSTNDYHRRLHNYRYEFLEDIADPKRLVFYQMAADYYLGPDFDHYYIGDHAGLLQESSADTGGNTYKTNTFSFSDRWLASHDLIALDKNTAKANRGIIQRSSTLNNVDFPVFMHTYGRSWGSDKMLFDLAGETVTQSFKAGDVITGEFEFVLPPKDPANYWGADTEFSERLATYTQPWEAVFDEYRYNHLLQVTANKGLLIKTFPIEILADQTGPSVIADLTIQAGGLGRVPVTIKNAVVGKAINIERYINEQWVALEVNAATANSYYQGYQNASGTIDYTFSIPRPSGNLADSWRLRISYVTPLFEETMSGNLSDYLQQHDVGTAKDNLWQAPTDAKLMLTQEIIQLMSEEKYAEAREKAHQLGAYLIAFDDTSTGTAKRFYVLHIGWQGLAEEAYRALGGTYVFNPLGENIAIQVPHPANDTNTDVEGITTYFGMNARYLLLSGTHRNSSVQTSACQADFRESDASHNVNHHFQQVHQAISDLSDETLFIELHGFGSETRQKLWSQCDVNQNPLLVNMSTGVGDTEPLYHHSFMHQLHNTISEAGSIRSCIYSPALHTDVMDIYSTSLGGTLNTNGRYTNGSSDVCNSSAATASERFLHLEQSYEVRRDHRDVMLNHLKSAWAEYTAAPDLVPDTFNFSAKTEASLDTQQLSSSITVGGINRATGISVTGGEYSIDGAAYTSATGTVTNGQLVTVRHNSSRDYATATSTTLHIGGISATFTSTTRAADMTPDAFNFASQQDVALGSIITSSAITVTGIESTVAITVSNGEYSVNNGLFTDSAGTVANGDLVKVRHTASESFSTNTQTQLNIGELNATFSSTTLVDPADTTAPVVTAPKDLSLASKGYKTRFAIAALKQQGTANDETDGSLTIELESINALEPVYRANKSMVLLRPGRHTLTWVATDTSGNKGTATQQLDVLPKASFMINQTLGEGQTASVSIALNGAAPDYPVSIPFTITGTADSQDYQLNTNTQSIIINRPEGSEQPQGAVDVMLIEDNLAETKEQIIFTMSEALQNVVVGRKQRHVITIAAQNVAPKARVRVSQNAIKGNRVYKNDGNIVLTANARDANNDSLNYSWSSETLTDIEQDTDPTTFEVNPSNHATGWHSLILSVSDSVNTVEKRKRIKIKSGSRITFNTAQDSDRDGLFDQDEMGDENGNGIADYLEDFGISTSQLLIGQDNPMETDPGLRFEIGEAAQDQELNSGNITESQLKTWLETQNTSYQADRSHAPKIILDYKIHGLEESGSVAMILLSLSEPLADESRLRKYNSSTGWQSFIVDANNTVESAFSSDGNCPTDGTLSYQEGLQTGSTCLRVSIQDGGPNDADGLADGTIVDPIAISTPINETSTGDNGEVSTANGGGGSLTLDTLMLLFIMLWFTRKIRDEKNKQPTATL